MEEYLAGHLDSVLRQLADRPGAQSRWTMSWMTPLVSAGPEVFAMSEPEMSLVLLG